MSIGNPEAHFVEGVNAYLASLPQTTLQRLFDKPSNCLAIFRLLSPFARALVLNCLWLEDAVPMSGLEALARRAEGKRHLDEALAALSKLHIIDNEHSTASTAQVIMLDTSFKEHFRQTLTGGGQHQSFGVPSNDSNARVNVTFLDDYATRQFEAILHFMVGSNVPTKPSSNVLDLLSRSGLIDRIVTRTGAKANITSRGFQFLLQDVNRQLWDLLLKFLELAEERAMDMVEVLGFLFMLGSLELGKAYMVSNLSRTQIQLLTELADYGLVYRQDQHSTCFYPTRLATTLTSSAPPLVTEAYANEEKGFVVVETNYRVYAYTSNPLQIAVLNLFVTLKTRFPNMVIGSLTRESVKSALRNGITAEQIVSYLSTHAHPQMRKQDPLLPPTVTDQIRLWENEKNRIQHRPGYLYDDFRAAADFKLVRDYARQLGVVLWEADESLPAPTCWRFFVNEDGHIPIRDFIKRRAQPAV